MGLSKLSIFGSVGALALAALVHALPASTPPPSMVQEGSSPESLKGLLRPTTGRPSQGGGVPLRRVDDEGPVTSHIEGDSLALEESYRHRLLAPDLDAREEAFDQIARDAARMPAAETALQAIADDLGDPDLAFTARLALREARRGSLRSNRFFSSPWPQGGGLDPLEALEHRMQEMLENDPFVRNFISSDPFAQDPFFRKGPSGLFRRRPSLFGAGAEDPFEELRQRMGEWRQEIQDGRSGSRAPGAAPQGAKTQVRSSSMSVESTPDGVQVEVTEDDGSGPTTQVYKAPTMEALLESYPELKGRFR